MAGWKRSRRIFRSEVEDDLVLTSGVHQSVTEGGISGYRFGIAFWATSYFSDLGRGVPRGPFLFLFVLFFFFFCFLISFIDFAYCIQTRSNHFLNFCKIHSKVFKPIGNIFSEPKQGF
jgi:hypothetical protein